MGSMEVFWLILQPFCPSNRSLKLLFTELYGIAHDLLYSAIVTVLFFTEICGSVLSDPQYTAPTLHTGLLLYLSHGEAPGCAQHLNCLLDARPSEPSWLPTAYAVVVVVVIDVVVVTVSAGWWGGTLAGRGIHIYISVRNTCVRAGDIGPRVLQRFVNTMQVFQVFCSVP